jgi:hypothetical protein
MILYDGRMVQVFNDHSEDIRFSGLVFDLKRPTVSEFRCLETNGTSAVIQVAESSDYAVENGKFVWTGDWNAGSYFRGGAKYVGSLGLRTLQAVQWGVFETPVSIARGNGFTPTVRDRQDAALISFAVGGAGMFPRGAVLAAERGGVDLALKYKSGWSAAQRTDALTKAQMLTEADTVVLQTARASTSAASRYRSSGGTIPPGSDVDHIIDLQLGGSDTVRNMLPLNSSVNRSLGAQIQLQIKNLPPGTRINRVTIGDR